MSKSSIGKLFVPRRVVSGVASRLISGNLFWLATLLGILVSPSMVISGEISRLNVPGRYEGTYSGASILLSVLGDGTYQLRVDAKATPNHQRRFPLGKSYSSQSSWSVDDGRIRFSNFANPADLFRQGFPAIRTEFSAKFDERTGTLSFLSETNLIVRRVKS